MPLVKFSGICAPARLTFPGMYGNMDTPKGKHAERNGGSQDEKDSNGQMDADGDDGEP